MFIGTCFIDLLHVFDTIILSAISLRKLKSKPLVLSYTLGLEIRQTVDTLRCPVLLLKAEVLFAWWKSLLNMSKFPISVKLWLYEVQFCK